MGAIELQCVYMKLERVREGNGLRECGILSLARCGDGCLFLRTCGQCACK